MSCHSYPARLFDVQAALRTGDVESARNLVTNQAHRWKNWLTAEEIQTLRAAGTPEQALEGGCPPGVPAYAPRHSERRR